MGLFLFGSEAAMGILSVLQSMSTIRLLIFARSMECGSILMVPF